MIESFLARLTELINSLWSDRARRTGLIRTVSSAGLLVLAAVLATVLTFQVDKATDWVEHTYKVRGLAGQAIQSLQDAEIAVRDHIVSPSSDSLVAYRGAWRPVFDRLAEARGLVRDNRPQIDRIDEIDRLVEVLSGASRSRRDDGEFRAGDGHHFVFEGRRRGAPRSDTKTLRRF